MAKSKQRKTKPRRKRPAGGADQKQMSPMAARPAAAAPPVEPLPDMANMDEAALKTMAQAMMSQQRFSDAAAVFHRLTEVAPNTAQYFNDLGTALVMAERIRDGRIAQARAIELAPDVPKYRINMAKVMMMQRDFISANEMIDQVMPSAPAQRQEELKQLQAICLKELEMLFGTMEEIKAGPMSQAVPRLEPQAPRAEAPMPDAAPKRKPVAAPAPDPGAFFTAPTAAPMAPAMAAGPAGPALEPTDEPLNILFVQEAPCIRNYKTATALRARGHNVTLLYSKAKLSQMYKGLSDDVYTNCIQMKSYRHLWDLTGRFDVVHCHNEPDHLTMTALAGDSPVIHDTHDLISLRAGGNENLAFLEGMANRGAHGRIYTTPYQREAAKSLYGVKGASLVFYNYTSAADLPKRFLPKLSAADSQTHIVYEGGIGGNGHRDFGELFVNLARMGVHVHIYPVHFDPAIQAFFAPYPLVHYHQPQSPKQIMEEMTQYDIGIIPFNIVKGNKQFLDSTIANKLFEYMAAGLPVVASPLQSYVDYFRENKVGKVFNTADDIMGSLDWLRQVARTTDVRAYAKTYEGEVHRLEAFYRQIIAAYHGRLPAEAAQVIQPPAGLGAMGGHVTLSGAMM